MTNIFEDSHIFVANKPAGIATLPERSGQQSLIELLATEKQLWPVNRIDKRVSGLVVFAKNTNTAAQLNELMQKGQIQKYYKAITSQKPVEEAAVLVNYLEKNSKTNKAIVVAKASPKSKKAQLQYTNEHSSDRYYMLDIQLLTGRFHQIRAQLAHIGCPIVGDLKYGAKRSSPDGSIFLHCYKMTLIHPHTHEQLTFATELPTLWQKYGF
jgi:23S rRNA pseudouridine1911/1915/1917 synthase